MGATEWAMLIVLSVLWGGTFFFIAIAVREVPPFTLVFARVGLAAAALLIYLYGVGQGLPRDPRLWAGLAVMAIGNNVLPFSLIVWGQTQIPSGLASILNATTPLFAVVFAHVLTADERLTSARIGGVALGLFGVATMTGVELLGGIGLAVLAQFACLAAAASYALTGIYGRRFRTIPAPIIAAGQLICSTVVMLPVVLLVDRPWTLALPSPATLGAIVTLAVVSTAFAYVLFFRVLAVAGATNLMLVTFLIPVSALFLGLFVLGERLEPRHFAGMALIALGLAAIDGRAIAWSRRLTRGP